MPLRATRDLVKELLGVSSYEITNPVTNSVGTSAEQILRQNPNRIWMSLTNLSANAMYVGPFADPSSGKGYLLNASGGTISLDFRFDLMLVTREWFALAGGAGSEILVVEQVLSH